MLAYARGEAAAFDILYARHKGGVYRYVLRQCSNSGVADELFQDVWTSVIRIRGSYTPSAKFATWLYTLARNRLVDHWRSSGHATLISVDEGDAIKRGQVLAELVDDDQKARITEAQAQVKLREAELEKLLHGARPEKNRRELRSDEESPRDRAQN